MYYVLAAVGGLVVGGILSYLFRSDESALVASALLGIRTDIATLQSDVKSLVAKVGAKL